MNILSLLRKDEEILIRYETYKSSENIFYEGDECLYVAVVLEGSVKISSYSRQGNETVFNTIRKDQMFGNNLLFSSSPFYKGDVTAMENVKIALIKKEDLIDILKNNDEFLLEYLKIQSNFGKELNSKIKLLSNTSAKDRLLYYLEDNGGTVHYLSITSLARELNLERETLSRTISSLTKKGIISHTDKTLKVRP